MSHRVRPLTADDLPRLPADCRACLFWELPGAARGPRRGREAQQTEAKHLWQRSLELDWGPPGVLLRDGDHTLGFATCAPSWQAMRTRRLGSTPSEDALILLTLWVAPEHRGGGIATMLLHRILRQAHDHGLRAVEATATRSAHDTPCLLPEGFLLASGFEVHHPHPTHPLLRLDLRQTARWQDAMEHALEGVRAVLGRGERRPAPTTS